MKILRMDIKGFRSLKDVTWTPGDLNVVIGPNGAGKSNLLRMLELIAVSAEGGLGKYVQSCGGMEPLVWDGAADSIWFRVKASPLEEASSVEKDSLIYRVDLERLGATSAFRIGGELLATEYDAHGVCFTFFERRGLNAIISRKDEQLLDVPEDSLSEEETLLSMVAGPFTANKLIPPFRSQLAAWRVYHDVHVNRDAPIRQSATARLEKRLDPDGQNLVCVLHTLYTGDRDFKKDIDSAMRAAFGDDYDELVFPPAADQKIQLRVRWKTLHREQSAADLSDGTLRFLLLLTALISPSAAPVVAIDEPETGLHPAMFPIIAEHAVDAARRVQVIFTTHSPQFLDAFGDTRPTTTVAKWEDGESILKTLDGAALDDWLREFSLGSLFRTGELEAMT